MYECDAKGKTMFTSMPLTQNLGPQQRPGGLLLEAENPPRFIAGRALNEHREARERNQSRRFQSRAGVLLGQAPSLG